MVRVITVHSIYRVDFSRIDVQAARNEEFNYIEAAIEACVLPSDLASVVSKIIYAFVLLESTHI